MFRPKYDDVVRFLEAHYDLTEKQILENKSPRAIEARRVLFHSYPCDTIKVLDAWEADNGNA